MYTLLNLPVAGISLQRRQYTSTRHRWDLLQIPSGIQPAASPFLIFDGSLDCRTDTLTAFRPKPIGSRGVNFCGRTGFQHPGGSDDFFPVFLLPEFTCSGYIEPIHRLAMAVAAHSRKPVIGFPIDSGPMQGLDSWLSTVQMPAGIPGATIAVEKLATRSLAT